MITCSSASQAKASKTLLQTKFSPLAAVSVLLAASFAPAQAANFISETEYFSYSLPTDVQKRCNDKNNCPNIEIQHLKSNQSWIDTLVNKRVNNLVINHGISDKPASTATSNQATKTALDAFSRAQFKEAPRDYKWSYELSVTPSYVGHVNDVELIKIDSYEFTGGAHGIPYRENLMFDQKLKRQIKLNDILITGKKPKFEAQAYDAYKKWVATFDKDLKNYEKNWPFSLSDNIMLTDKGVDLLYQPYAIAPYASGMPTLTIPYRQLNGIIKPQYVVK